MCQRNLEFPIRLVVGCALLFCALLGGLLWGSGKLKGRVDRWQVSSSDVMMAAQTLVAQNPSVRNPVGFSTLEQTTVEHWDGRRWRVSGYVDTRPRPGIRVRTLYFAVVLNNGNSWNLEDLQLQSMEFGAAPARKN